MDRIAILRMGEFLLVALHGDVHDRLATTLQDELAEKLVSTRASGVLIDISALDIVDSFIARVLANIAQMSRVLDAATVLVGMRPAVAMTLVDMGVTLPGILTALDAERGMARLRKTLRGAHAVESSAN